MAALFLVPLVSQKDVSHIFLSQNTIHLARESEKYLNLKCKPFDSSLKYSLDASISIFPAMQNNIPHWFLYVFSVRAYFRWGDTSPWIWKNIENWSASNCILKMISRQINFSCTFFRKCFKNVFHRGLRKRLKMHWFLYGFWLGRFKIEHSKQCFGFACIFKY